MFNPFTLNTTVELLCFLTAFICLRREPGFAWSSMILYMLLVCIAEITGLYIKKQHQPNSWVYNVLLIFEAGFISYIFAIILNRYFNSRPWIIAGLAVIAVIYCYEFWLHGIMRRNNYTNTAIAVIFIFYSLIYYYHLLKDELYVNLRYSADFWWVTGVLLYYFGDIACDVFYPALTDIIKIPDSSFSYIYKGLNFLLYTSWAYSFYCRLCRATKSKTLSSF
jgi:hypothetical protein